MIVIMIGTNKVGHGSSNSSQTSDGVKAIVGVLRKQIPGAKILLLDIFPRGGDLNDAGRKAVTTATAGYQTLHDVKYVFCANVSSQFVNQDGTIRSLLMPDALHPNAAGYEIWAKAMEPILSKLLGN